MVTNKQVQVGQVVQMGQPLLALVPVEDIWVIANYKEDQIKNMRVGQPATIAANTRAANRRRGMLVLE